RMVSVGGRWFAGRSAWLAAAGVSTGVGVAIQAAFEPAYSLAQRFTRAPEVEHAARLVKGAEHIHCVCCGRGDIRSDRLLDSCDSDARMGEDRDPWNRYWLSSVSGGQLCTPQTTELTATRSAFLYQ